MVIFLIVLAILVLLVVWGFTTYNGLVKRSLSCDEAFATMDVYLKKRFDMIPNLVETVKGYAKHESETLEKVIAARNAGAAGQTVEQRMESENQISGALRQIFALTESYPDLKANQNFMQLMGQLQTIEADIANSRKYFNAVVRDYNTATMTVPSNIIANMTGFSPRPMFEVDDASERQNVKVQF
ncbi:MAG: LemA family protein [Oscillospiraceae bacterium]|nr:LemA family protein [Oscillospiraceae bacterium]